jgi:hypothetical protein
VISTEVFYLGSNKEPSRRLMTRQLPEDEDVSFETEAKDSRHQSTRDPWPKPARASSTKEHRNRLVQRPPGGAISNQTKVQRVLLTDFGIFAAYTSCRVFCPVTHGIDLVNIDPMGKVMPAGRVYKEAIKCLTFAVFEHAKI